MLFINDTDILLYVKTVLKLWHRSRSPSTKNDLDITVAFTLILDSKYICNPLKPNSIFLMLSHY